jgi:hypothetical protein
MDPSWPDVLATLSRSGEASLLQVLAPEEWSPPLGEEVELLDAESGETVPTRLGTPELAAYADQLTALLAGIENECRRLAIASVTLNTGTALPDVLFTQLPAAGILKG